MSQASKPKNKQKIPKLFIWFFGLIGFGILLAASGFGFAASQETHDPFCASCHTQPESTFVMRSAAAQASDLASYHTAQKTLCIGCHAGPGIAGRMQAELLGARNAALWFTGLAVQPAVLNYPIRDANCLKCHQDVTVRGFTPKEQITVPSGIGEGEREGRVSHWHRFLARWQAASPSAGTCVSCHASHATGYLAQDGFMDGQAIQTVCDACHQAIRKEEGG